MTREAQIRRLCSELEKLRAQAEVLCKELTQELRDLESDKEPPKPGRRKPN